MTKCQQKLKSDIMAINRLRMGTDGKGVSTLVAFYSCPLHCKYCINKQCHKESYRLNSIPRANYTPKELIEILEKDEIYYLMSEGGIVFGGGEPLLQAEYIHEVCRLMSRKWKKRKETSLNVNWKYVSLLVDDIDEWIIDIKDMNPDVYQAYTGATIERMKDNLLKLSRLVPKERLHIRIPYIPHYNDKYYMAYSKMWVEDHLGVQPELFEYLELPHNEDEKRV